MTGKTSTTTYALIDEPAPDDLSLQWTATIFRKGFKRTTVLHAFSEQHLKDKCAARGVTSFVSRTESSASPSCSAASA